MGTISGSPIAGNSPKLRDAVASQDVLMDIHPVGISPCVNLMKRRKKNAMPTG